MTWYREWFGEEYLELYAHRDEDEARRQVEFFESKVDRVDGAILDLASGRGRHLVELRDRNLRAVGCDLSYVLLASGKQEYGITAIARADMRHLPFRDASFGALVNFFTSFGYFESEADNLATIREMARVVSAGGRLLFDYLNVDRELERLVEREEKVTESGKVTIERWYDGKQCCFNKRIVWGDRSFIERVRAYRFEEVRTMFQSAGFRIDEVCGDFDATAFTEQSPRMIVLATRELR